MDRNEYLAQWREANREKTRAANRRYRERNREKINAAARAKASERVEYHREWREKNRETHRAYHREYYHRKDGRKPQVLAGVRLRQARLLNATPSWLTEEHKSEMAALYASAAERGMHVDHVVPLRGEEVCGLHVPWNLQLLLPAENIAKSNRVE